MEELYRFLLEKLGDNEEYCQAFSFEELAELAGQLEINVPVDEISAVYAKELSEFFDELIRKINESADDVVVRLNDYQSEDGELLGFGFSIIRF